MKKYLIGLAALAVVAGPAHAGCSKSSLSGNWVVDVLGGLGLPTIVSGGKFTTAIGGSALVNVNITTFGSNCRGSGTMKILIPSTPPTTYFVTAIVRAEVTPASGKPNNLAVIGTLGTSTIALQMNRLP